MNTSNNSDPERARILRGRNIAMALILGFFVLLVYFLTFVKMG